MKSKIKQVMQTGSSEWQGKTLTKFSLEMDNGDTGTFTIGFKDTDSVPVIGQELDYEMADRGYGNEIKPNRPAFSGGGGGFKKWTPAQVAQQDAVKLTCSALEGGTLPLKQWKEFFLSAKTFMVENNETPVEAVSTPATHIDKAQAMINSGIPTAPEATDDDLPF